MSQTSLRDLLLHVRKSLAIQQARDVTDYDLLRCFLASRDDAAFAVLVHRHGPMVLSVCERVLGDRHAAEDAFQATFIVLLRRAGSIRRNAPLANWLYAVAQRIATKAKAQSAKRLRREMRAEPMSARDHLDLVSWQEIKSVLDEEIVRLPRKYRAPIVLCYLEGKTHEQAANEMGCAKTSLTSRLARGRELLRRGLARRGISLSAGAVTLMLAEKVRAASVAAKLTLSTLKAATGVAAGKGLAKAGLSAGAITLAEEAMRAVFWKKLQVVVLMLLVGLAVGGVGWASYSSLAEKEVPAFVGVSAPAAVAALALRSAQQDDPEKPFRAMEAKIRAAQSLKVVFEMEGEAEPKGRAKFKGIGVIAPGNKLRMEVDGKSGEDTSFQLFVSDGKDSVEERDQSAVSAVRLVPKRLGADTLAVLARAGTFFAVISANHIASKDQDYDIAVEKSFAVNEFVLGPKDQVGKREARVVECTIAMALDGEHKATGRMKMWIDVQTMLPIKRIATLKEVDDERPTVLAEVYTAFLIDPTLDAKLFELPKAKQQPATVQGAANANKSKAVSSALDLQGDLLPAGAVTRLGTTRFRPGSTWGVKFVPGTNVLVSNTLIFKQCRTWDIAIGVPLKRIWSMQAGAFSTDGKFMLTSDLDLCDFVTGKQLRHLGPARMAYRAIALSPDGKIAAAGGQGDPRKNDNEGAKIRLWDTDSGKELRRLEGHTAMVQTVAFSPDGKTLASGGEDKTLRLWDVVSGQELRQLGEVGGKIQFVAFAPDGKLLATADDNRKLQIWDAGAGKRLHALQSDSERFQPIPGPSFGLSRDSIAFSPDSKFLACVGLGGGIDLWDPLTGKLVRQWVAHADTVKSVSFSSNGKMLASVGTKDSAIRLWYTATGLQINADAGHSGEIHLLQFADDKTLRSGGGDLKMLAWDVKTGKARDRLFDGLQSQQTAGALTLLDFTADGKVLAIIDTQKDGSIIRLWDTALGKEMRVLDGHKKPGGSRSLPVTGKFSPDGKVLASMARGFGGDDGLRIWDVATGKELHHLQGYIGFAFAPDGQSLFLKGLDKNLRRIETTSGKELGLWNCPGEASGVIAVSTDGTSMASTTFQEVVAWITETGKEFISFSINGPKGEKLLPRSLAFSPSGRVLAIGGIGMAGLYSPPFDNFENTGTVQLWDAYSGQKIREIDGPQGAIMSLAFSSDGRTLATGGDDSTILLWDLAVPPLEGKQGLAAPTAAEIDGLWSDLGADATKADRAIWMLARAGNLTLPLLTERLKSVTPADAKLTAKLIADLGSDQFAQRQAATKELSDLGEGAESALRKAVAGNPSLELRKRLQQILEKRDQDPEIRRRLRGVEALEHIGTPGALQVLKSVADESPQPRVSQTAAAALRRLTKR
jgi:RNA polymerase sigma factor (sigma-70 family)